MRNLTKQQLGKLHYIFAMLFILYVGCYTPEKAHKDIDKAINKYPDMALSALRDSFPCATQKIDTVYDWHDTTIFLECPPLLDTLIYKEDTGYRLIKADTVSILKIVKLRGTTITKTKLDSATIKLYSDSLVEVNAKLKISYTAINNYEKLAKEASEREKSYLICILLLLLIAGGVITYQTFKTKRK